MKKKSVYESDVLKSKAKKKNYSPMIFDLAEVTKAIGKAIRNAYATGYNDAIQEMRSAMDKKVRKVRA